MFIRPAETKDLPRVAEIHIYGWRCAYRGIVTDDIMFNRRSVLQCMARWEKELNSGGGETYVFDDGIVKAFLTVGPSREEDRPGAFELWGIYVEPLFKRQGIGRQLVAFCEIKAAEQGFKEIVLRVLEKNKPARKFYEKMGYRLDGDGVKRTIEEISAEEVRYIKKL